MFPRRLLTLIPSLLLVLAVSTNARAQGQDCNSNGIPDARDIANGTSQDCNADGIPDECASCPPVDVVFVMDTSGSMNDEAAALCSSIVAVVANLSSQGIVVNPAFLGIRDTGGGGFGCLTGTVAASLGTIVPGAPPCCLALGNSEDWGPATAIVAQNYPWSPGAIRLIVPISDEGARNGDPCLDPGDDRDSINNAIMIANANNATVSPIAGTGSSPCVISMGMDLAAATGGVHFISTQPSADIAAAIANLIVTACALFGDCNSNGIPDACDIAGGTSADSDGNGIPDECQPECLAVVGTGPGSSLITALNHTFAVDIAHVTSYHPVLLTDLHEIVLPRPQFPSTTYFPELFARPVMDFTVQVVMWNPNAYPLQPEQRSHGLRVRVLANGALRAVPYGVGTGMTVHAELAYDSFGRRVVRFPFTIP